MFKNHIQYIYDEYTLHIHTFNKMCTICRVLIIAGGQGRGWCTLSPSPHFPVIFPLRACARACAQTLFAAHL